MTQQNWQKLREPDFLQTFQQRSLIIKAIREFFDNRGYLEVETPQLVKVPGSEPYLSPFKTYLKRRDSKKETAYLITSPEYQMKKLLCGGLSKIYQITSSFRDEEELSPLHNLEFKILEWYRAGANYLDIAQELAELIYFVNQKLNQSDILKYKEAIIDLTPPFNYLSLEESFAKYLGLDLALLISDKEKFIKTAAQAGIEVEAKDLWEDIFYKLFLTYIEPKLGFDKPTILFDYPASMAALSKLKTEDSRWAERFELYICGIEIANAFSELTDWREQLFRLKKERRLRKQLKKKVYGIDDSFIAALKSGLPECAGIALGVDRLVMILLDKKQLWEVILFPAKDIF